MRTGAVGGVLAVIARGGISWAAPDLEPDTLPVPPVPIVVSNSKVALPAVPSFALPATEPGVHSVRELRVRGRGLLDSELTVTGYVTWIYDCMTALAKPGVPLAELQERIDDNPSLCERPKFALGANPTTSPEAALWVVDVPRPANKRERMALSPAQLRARPAVPTLAVGDFVAVTGTFALRSSHGEQNSEGLVVYRGLKHVKPSALPPAPVASALPPAAGSEPAIVRTPPLRAVVPVWKRNDSIEDYERCNQSLAAARLDDAVTECRRAVEMWNGNHLAWYALGNAYATRDLWSAAQDAYEHCVQLRPDQAMYQLYAGIAMYKLALGELRADEARRSNAPMDTAAAPSASANDATAGNLESRPSRPGVTPRQSLSPSARFEPARSALTAAVGLAPALALAHYYLGEVYREQDQPSAAAEAFIRAIQADPSQPLPYIALAELYRSWDYIDQSMVVAQQGIAHVNASANANLWYELGMAHAAKRRDAEAITAFSSAIRGGNLQAKFQRGQIYIRRNELANAKRDLEAFMTSAGPSLSLAKQIAGSLLAELARKLDGSSTYMRLPTHLDPNDEQRR